MTEEAAFPNGKGLMSPCTKIQHLVFPGSWLYCKKILCRIACAPSFFGLEAVSGRVRSPCPQSPCPSQALSLVLPQEADPCVRQRKTLWRIGETLALHGSATTSTTGSRPQDWQPSAPHTSSCPCCRGCTFPRMSIHFKGEEARKTNGVSPGRGVSGCSVYSVLIKDAETSSPLSRAPAVSTCCNNKLCSKNLALHILCVKYKISNGLQTAYNHSCASELPHNLLIQNKTALLG